MWKLQYETVDHDNKPRWEDSSYQLLKTRKLARLAKKQQHIASGGMKYRVVKSNVLPERF